MSWNFFVKTNNAQKPAHKHFSKLLSLPQIVSILS
jgi:hypothetical protein